jgi:hypothetical protein
MWESQLEQLANSLGLAPDLEEFKEEIRQATARLIPPSWEPLEALDPRGPATTTSDATPDQLMARLDRAYKKLDQLLARQHTEGKSPVLDLDIEAAWAALDKLQESAGIEVRKQLDASVEIPPRRLEELLHRVDAELNCTDGEL